jgi:hypothetical protein
METITNCFHLYEEEITAASAENEQEKMPPSSQFITSSSLLVDAANDTMVSSLKEEKIFTNLHNQWSKMTTSMSVNCASLFLGLSMIKGKGQLGYKITPTLQPVDANMRRPSLNRVFARSNLEQRKKTGVLGTLYGFEEHLSVSSIATVKYIVWPYVCHEEDETNWLPVKTVFCEHDKFTTPKTKKGLEANEIQLMHVLNLVTLLLPVSC